MSKNHLFASPLLAALVGLCVTAPLHARRPPTSAPTDCAKFDITFLVQPEQTDVHAAFQNVCYPAVDIDARVELLVDGVVVAARQLGADDKAQFDLRLLVGAEPGPLEAAMSEASQKLVTLRVLGTARMLVRNKIQVVPYTSEQSVSVPA